MNSNVMLRCALILALACAMDQPGGIKHGQGPPAPPAGGMVRARPAPNDRHAPADDGAPDQPRQPRKKPVVARDSVFDLNEVVAASSMKAGRFNQVDFEKAMAESRAERLRQLNQEELNALNPRLRDQEFEAPDAGLTASMIETNEAGWDADADEFARILQALAEAEQEQAKLEVARRAEDEARRAANAALGAPANAPKPMPVIPPVPQVDLFATLEAMRNNGLGNSRLNDDGEEWVSSLNQSFIAPPPQADGQPDEQPLVIIPTITIEPEEPAIIFPGGDAQPELPHRPFVFDDGLDSVLPIETEVPSGSSYQEAMEILNRAAAAYRVESKVESKVDKKDPVDDKDHKKQHLSDSSNSDSSSTLSSTSDHEGSGSDDGFPFDKTDSETGSSGDSGSESSSSEEDSQPAVKESKDGLEAKPKQNLVLDGIVFEERDPDPVPESFYESFIDPPKPHEMEEPVVVKAQPVKVEVQKKPKGVFGSFWSGVHEIRSGIASFFTGEEKKNGPAEHFDSTDSETGSESSSSEEDHLKPVVEPKEPKIVEPKESKNKDEEPKPVERKSSGGFFFANDLFESFSSVKEPEKIQVEREVEAKPAEEEENFFGDIWNSVTSIFKPAEEKKKDAAPRKPAKGAWRVDRVQDEERKPVEALDPIDQPAEALDPIGQPADNPAQQPAEDPVPADLPLPMVIPQPVVPVAQEEDPFAHVMPVQLDQVLENDNDNGDGVIPQPRHAPLPTFRKAKQAGIVKRKAAKTGNRPQIVAAEDPNKPSANALLERARAAQRQLQRPQPLVAQVPVVFPQLPQGNPAVQPLIIPVPQPQNNPVPQPPVNPVPQPQNNPVPQPQNNPVPLPQNVPAVQPQNVPVPQPQGNPAGNANAQGNQANAPGNPAGPQNNPANPLVNPPNNPMNPVNPGVFPPVIPQAKRPVPRIRLSNTSTKTATTSSTGSDETTETVTTAPTTEVKTEQQQEGKKILLAEQHSGSATFGYSATLALSLAAASLVIIF